MDVLQSRMDDLQVELAEMLAAREEAAGRAATRRAEAEEALKAALADAKAQADDAARQVAQDRDGERERIEARHARNLERIEAAHARAVARADEVLSRETARFDEARKRARAEAQGAPDTPDRLQAALAEVEDLGAAAKTLRDEMTAFAAAVRVRLRDPLGARPPDGVPIGKACAAAKSRIEDVSKRLAASRRQAWVPFARSYLLVTIGCVVLMLHGASLLALKHFRPDQYDLGVLLLPISCFGFLLATLLLAHTLKQRAAAAIEPLDAGLAEAEALLRRRDSWLKDAEIRRREELESHSARALSGAEQRLDEQARESRRTYETRIEILDEQKAHAIARGERHRDRRLARAAERFDRENAYLGPQHKRVVARLQEEHAAKLKELEEQERRETADLARRWSERLADVRRIAAQALSDRHAACPPWNDPRWTAVKMTPVFPEAVRIGDLRFELKSLATPPRDDRFSYPGDGSATLPLDVTFPGLGSLVINADASSRDRAHAALFSTVLRILCSLPPGKAKFTLVDPVGLGQSFSALMHLADSDESLVGGRIWTEPAHIEKRLAELTEHIEKVIQKYLRNRYRSIDEYNREVGPMAEPYRFLVIADFPSGFSEMALDRLASIARSGTRCGVTILMVRDTRVKLPSTADRAALETGGLVLDAVDGGFATGTKALREGVVGIEPAPPPETLNALLQSVGRQCADAKRVEIPFDIIAPRRDAAWSLTAEDGIRIPLGRAGADRLQHLDLGRGTAQHALIAGKTGSGKSTLFHVMITNAALWYAPRELELYLIDFKKGVEFKTYAVNALPQARVIAIESDREFGVSVLRRVYAELGARAERFRAAGVQDFAGYRKAAPDERLPRTLLLIDEFQEFFTEEDAVAQEAALMLDRIVRQGRAFGVHVVLGSQTLGGSYTLAKSTLGQMAVRIALPCSEADSYLILSDDNAAARLLSRPGEAIYNEKSGMVEGNDPFQIAWLPDETRDAKLQIVRELAAGDGARRAEPTTVFEGNVPADIRNNVLLAERLAKPPTAAPAVACAWIGEANAIKGPTEARFKAQRGGNLLIVGQQRESALSVACSAIVSLAAQHPPSGARFVVLDGSPRELDHGKHFAELAKAIPHPLEVVDAARVPAVMEELNAEVTARLEGGGKGGRVFLVVHDLQGFRKLRQGDELDFSGGEEKKASPDRCFANVLGEGPPLGVHSIVWCDSLNNVNRMLSRKLLKEFDLRVLFQMSATDSSELIDSPQAGKLGLYRGLLFLEEEGSVEKFRPYGPLDAETVRAFGQAMRGGR